MSLGDVDSPQPERASVPSDPPPDSDASVRLSLITRWPALARVPPLTYLAAFAAIAHVALYRLLLPLLASKGLALPMLLKLAAPFTLNLAACAGMVALLAATLDIVRTPELTYAGRKLVIGALAGVVVSTVALATFLPNGKLAAQPQMVLLAAGALHTLVVQLSMTTLRRAESLAGRTTVGLVAATSLFALMTLIVRHAEPVSRWPFLYEGVASLHALGELAYLLVPIAAAFVVSPWDDDKESRAARRAGAIAVFCMAALFTAGARIPNAVYGHLMYSTLRLEWALERASLGYAVPVSLAVGAATSALFSRDPRHRQGGAALWLWLAGGYNPLTPARVFMAALATTLVCRAVLCVGATHSKKS
jgi:hypothetical protein